MDQLLADEQVADRFDAEANDTLWAVTGRMGRVTDMLDSAGTERLHRAFDSYGNVVSETHYDSGGDEVLDGSGFVGTAFGFQGRWLDADTGLQNNLNRWYDSQLGRFISEDPSGFSAGDANLYRSFGNSPTNFRDPSGLAKETICPKPDPKLFSTRWEDWGKNVIKWGVGPKDADQRIDTITVSELKKKCVTCAQAEAVRDFYQCEVKRMKNMEKENPTAQERARLMERIMELLKCPKKKK